MTGSKYAAAPATSGRRWVPARKRPELSRQHQRWSVQMQCHDGRTTRGRQAHDPVTGIVPPEVLPPHLVPRVEETYRFARNGITCPDTVALVIVAQGASQPEILLLGVATQGLGDDMIDFHRRPDDRLVGETVAAPAPGLTRNPLS